MSGVAKTAAKIVRKGLNLRTQRRMAMEIFGVGQRKVWLDPAKLPIIAKAKTRTQSSSLSPLRTHFLGVQKFFRAGIHNFYVHSSSFFYPMMLHSCETNFCMTLFLTNVLYLMNLGESMRELISKDIVRVIPTHRGKHFGRYTEQLIARHPVVQRIKAQYSKKAESPLASLDSQAAPAAASS